MNVGFNFDAHDLTVQMETMAQQLGIAAVAIVKVEGLMLLKTILKFTHPGNRAQGRKAVSRDVTRAITPLDPAKFRNKSLSDLMRKKDLPKLNEVMHRVAPGWKRWEVVPFDPTLHRSARDARGRVQRFKRKFTVETPLWKRYVRAVQNQVGSAKASWSVGIRETGGGTLPSWIAEHTAEGNYATTISVLQGESPRLVVKTRAKGVTGDSEFQRQVDRAMQTRVIAMRNKTRRMLRDPLKYANLYSQYQ